MRDEHSLHRCLKFMLQDRVACDVTFALNSPDGASALVPAHRFMLIARSPVFRAMFEGPLGTHNDIIRIPDVDPDAFRAMLSYVYSDEAEITADNAAFVLYAAKKYLLPVLAKACVQFLKEHLTASNVCEIFEMSKFYEEDTLKRSCLTFMKLNTELVLECAEFLELSSDSLLEIFQCDVLNASEVDIMAALLAWAAEVCSRRGEDVNPVNQRQALGQVFSRIRLACLPDDIIHSLLVKDGLLTEEEQDILRVYLETKNIDIVMPFPTQKRKRSSDGAFTCKLLNRATPATIIAGRYYETHLTTSEDISIHGIEVLDVASPSHTVYVTAVLSQNDEVICQHGLNPKHGRVNAEIGSLVYIPFCKQPKIVQGTFKITLNFKFVGGVFGTVPSGIPVSELVDACGVKFGVSQEHSTHVATVAFLPA